MFRNLLFYSSISKFHDGNTKVGGQCGYKVLWMRDVSSNHVRCNTIILTFWFSGNKLSLHEASYKNDLNDTMQYLGEVKDW